MEILQTPADEFYELARYPYPPRFAPVDAEHDLLMHYIDVGRRDAPAVLMLHGEPTWSFLYRHVINMVAEAGYRAIAPDLIGFGKSDKPADREDYTFDRHIAWVRALIDYLGLRRVILVGHDWGGMIGLRLVAETPERFPRVIATNTFLPTGAERLPEAFFAWRELSQHVPELDVGTAIQNATTTHVPLTVLEAYRAPFPDESYKAGVRAFPMLVPTSPDDPGAAENARAWEALEAYEHPFLCAFSDSDPITAGAGDVLRERIPGARDIEPVVIRGAHHFVQEDRGPELARAILDFLAQHPLPRAAAQAVREGVEQPLELAGDTGQDSADAGQAPEPDESA